MDLLTSYV
uniref:Uncharacterized protein n=1 Tax=Anguilla anguilla TaxID=7936 RepID=A0A0E9TP42_ANGAN